jgi:hypothetical protein
VLKNSVATSQETCWIYVIKIKWLMQFREIITVCSMNHIEYISGQNTKFFKVKGGGTYSLWGLNTKVGRGKKSGDWGGIWVRFQPCAPQLSGGINVVWSLPDHIDSSTIITIIKAAYDCWQKILCDKQNVFIFEFSILELL